MVRSWRILLLMLFLGGRVSLCLAAPEDNAFKAAAMKFQVEDWEHAASDFNAFVTNFPTSFRVPEAIFYAAEATINHGDFTQGIELLTANQYRAGELGDLYLKWIAQGHLGNTNFSAAAQAFAQLKTRFPDSTNRLEACVSEAAAYAKLEEWSRVTELLGSGGSIFQQITSGVTNELVARGYLLLGEAELAQKHFNPARAAVERLESFPLSPEFAWRKGYLRSRIEMAEGRFEEASLESTNLIALATSTGSRRLRAETYVLLASILEQVKEYDRAITAHEQNLSTNAPVAQQRLAVLKIAQLSLAQNKTAEAIQQLEKYWTQFPKSEAADTVLLTWGELLLKQSISGREVSTNLLDQAASRFNALLSEFPQSPLLGKALLGKGWCLWYGPQPAASEDLFRAAVERLPISVDQATARFKLADAQFTAGRYEDAIRNYHALIEGYASVSAVKNSLLEQALYQTTRAALALTNLPVASEAVRKIVDWFPDGLTGDRCLLLVAEGYEQNGQPAKARELLADFQLRFGTQTNALLPQVRLAIARTYEKEGRWHEAITNYDAWIATFSEHPQLPEALFARAWATDRDGQETNALAWFGKFVEQFPAHALTSRAKWWIGDYYFQQGNFARAEANYPFTTNFAASELYFPAHLRAGRAAMLRGLGYKDAIGYFTNLISNPACPENIKVKAAMAAGDAYMSRNEAGATNRNADLIEATNYFNFVLKNFPTNAQVPLAWGLLGNCYKELGATDSRYYDRATEAYLKVLRFPGVSVGTQRKAMVGLGIITEARAEGKVGAEQKALLNEALGNYLDAFAFRDAQEGDAEDLYWIQKAGLESARVADLLGEWSKAINIYTQLQGLPNLSSAFQATLEKRIIKAREHLVSAKD